MNGLITPETVFHVVLLEVGVREHLVPVGKQLGVHDGAVDLVRVEPDHVRPARHPDQGLEIMKRIFH